MGKFLFGLLGVLFTISANAGCNLLNPDTAVLGDINTNGVIDELSYRIVSDFIPVVPGQKYVGNGQMYMANSGLRDFGPFITAYYNANKEFISGSRIAQSGKVITIPDGVSYARVEYGAPTNEGTAIIAQSKLQFKQGDTATAYEPYNPLCATCDGTIENYTSATGTVTQNGTPTPTNPIEPVFYTQGDMVLRKVDDYADTYDATTGKITRRVGFAVLDGTEVITIVGRMLKVGKQLPVTKNNGWQARRLCSHGIAGNAGAENNSVEVDGDNVWFGGQLGFTAETGRQWLTDQYAAGTPVTVWYPLATPVEETVPTSYCQQNIRVATTKYVETQFGGLSASLAAAVNTVNTVVTNTITQAASIATLQSGKQTRPADETCPAGKKCLLVEGTDGKPHWYEIFDPINRWMEAFFKTNPDGHPVENGVDFRRCQGNPDFRETYIDGSRDVYVRQWTEASPARTVGGMYQTLSAGDIENAGTWAVEFDGTEGNINAGVVYGIAKCTSVAGTFATKLTSAQESAFYELPAPMGQTDRTGYEREKFTQCWCKMTAVGVPGDDGTAANGDVYPVNPSSSAWVFLNTRSSAAGCAYDCTGDCANGVRLHASFRSAMFGLSD